MKNFNVNDQGFYGRFGGAYVPEILHANVEKLRECYLREMEDESFQQEFRLLLRDYVGRPSPLYYARRLSEKYGTRIYLKREDLNHTGAHKINNVLGQVLLAKKMGKTSQRLFAAAFPPFAAKSSHLSAVCPKNRPVSPEKPFFLLNFAPGACYT